MFVGLEREPASCLSEVFSLLTLFFPVKCDLFDTDKK